MYDLPEHFPIPVNKEGQGPETDLAKVESYVCWCDDTLCPKFAVSGDSYREALTTLIVGKKVPAKNAEMLLLTLIQLGWSKDHDTALQGALRRAQALADGDLNWMSA